KLYRSAAHFYVDVFASEFALPADIQALTWSGAAYAAILAANGKGKDAATLDKEKASLRRQALAWLREALKARTTQLAGADPKGRAELVQLLRNWQKDADLAVVRDEQALAKLPQAEREAWQQFWADVAALLKKADEK